MSNFLATPAPVRETRFFRGGNATFTIEVDAAFAKAHGYQPHYTFNVVVWPAAENDYNRDLFNVLVLTGPSNEEDYTYLGQLHPQTGNVRLTKASRFNDKTKCVKALRRVLARLFKGELDVVEAAGWRIIHSGRCCRCNRVLTTPRSVELGIGPVCETLID